MAENNATRLPPEVFREHLYGNALSEATEKTGARLLIVATITLVVAIFEVTVTSPTTIPLDLSGQPDALISVLAVFNIALLVSYFMRASADYMKAREDWADVERHLEIEKIEMANRRARSTENNIMQEEDPDPYDPEPWWVEALDIRQNSMRRISEIEDRIGRRGIPLFFRHLRLWVFMSTPPIVGLLAAAHSFNNALSFLGQALGLE